MIHLITSYVFNLLSMTTYVKFADDNLNTLCFIGFKSKWLACLFWLWRKKNCVVIKHFFCVCRKTTTKTEEKLKNIMGTLLHHQVVQKLLQNFCCGCTSTTDAVFWTSNWDQDWRNVNKIEDCRVKVCKIAKVNISNECVFNILH